MGISEVAGMGIGSNIHQVAHRIVTAAVQQAAESHPYVPRTRKVAPASTGPRNRKMRSLENVKFSAFYAKNEDYTHFD
jgi:hypothetical protein